MQMRTPRILAVLACGISVSFILLRLSAAEPQYSLVQPVTVNVAGQNMQLPAGQAVTLIGGLTPNQEGNVMIKVVLPNGSVSVAQVPASSIGRYSAVAATAPAAQAPAPAVVQQTAPAPAVAGARSRRS